VLKAVGTSYVAQGVGQAAGQYAAGTDFGSTIQSSLDVSNQTFINVVSGEVSNVATNVIYGVDPFENFGQATLSTAVSTQVGRAMGYLDEKFDAFNFEKLDEAGNVIEGEFKRLPGAVQNVLSTSLTATIQGKDITPEMLAGAVTNAYITADTVGKIAKYLPGDTGDWLLTNDDGRTLAALTTVVNQTATVALAGGDAGEAFNNALTTVGNDYIKREFQEGGGLHYLTEVTVEDLTTGKIFTESYDRLTGAHQATELAAEELNATFVQLDPLYKERQARFAAATADMEAYEAAKLAYEEGLANKSKNLSTLGEEYVAAAEFLQSSQDVNVQRIIEIDTILGFESVADDPNTPENEFTAGSGLIGTLQTQRETYNSALADIKTNRDLLDSELKPATDAITKVYVSVMTADTFDPEFFTDYVNSFAITPEGMAEDYQEINNEIDAYNRFIAVDSKTGAPTSQAEYDAKTDFAITEFAGQIASAAGMQLEKMTDGERTTFVSSIKNNVIPTLTNDAGFVDQRLLEAFTGTPGQATFGLAATPDAREFSQEQQNAINTAISGVSDLYSSAISADLGNVQYTFADISKLNSMGFNVGMDKIGQNITDPTQLTGLLSFNREVNVTGIDANNVIDVATGKTSFILDLNTGKYNPLDTSGLQSWDVDKGTVDTGSTGQTIQGLKGQAYLNVMQNVVDTVKAAGAQYVEDFNNFYSLNTVERALSYVSEKSGEDTWIIDSTANALKAGAGVLGAMNDTYIYFSDQAGEQTEFGNTLKALEQLGKDYNSQEYKDNLARINQKFDYQSAKVEDLDPNSATFGQQIENPNYWDGQVRDPDTGQMRDATWAETMKIRAGHMLDGVQEAPITAAMEFLGVEGFQEVAPWLAGGLVTKGVLGAAKIAKVSSAAVAPVAATLGVGAAGIVDVLESTGASADDAYTRSYEEITKRLVKQNAVYEQMGSPVRMTEEQIDRMAADGALAIAQKVGLVAGAATAASLGLGALAIDKLLIRGFAGDVAGDAVTYGVLNQIVERAGRGAVVTGLEGVTEGAESSLAELALATELHKINPDINISAEVATAGIMGTAIGSTLAGGFYSTTAFRQLNADPFDTAINNATPDQLDSVIKAPFGSIDPVTNLVSGFAPEINNLVQDADSAQDAIDQLQNIGFDPTIATTLTNSNSKFDAEIITEQEVIDRFRINNYIPTAEEIERFTTESIAPVNVSNLQTAETTNSNLYNRPDTGIKEFINQINNGDLTLYYQGFDGYTDPIRGQRVQTGFASGTVDSKNPAVFNHYIESRGQSPRLIINGYYGHSYNVRPFQYAQAEDGSDRWMRNLIDPSHRGFTQDFDVALPPELGYYATNPGYSNIYNNPTMGYDYATATYNFYTKHALDPVTSASKMLTESGDYATNVTGMDAALGYAQQPDWSTFPETVYELDSLTKNGFGVGTSNNWNQAPTHYNDHYNMTISGGVSHGGYYGAVHYDPATNKLYALSGVQKVPVMSIPGLVAPSWGNPIGAGLDYPADFYYDYNEYELVRDNYIWTELPQTVEGYASAVGLGEMDPAILALYNQIDQDRIPDAGDFNERHGQINDLGELFAAVWNDHYNDPLNYYGKERSDWERYFDALEATAFLQSNIRHSVAPDYSRLSEGDAAVLDEMGTYILSFSNATKDGKPLLNNNEITSTNLTNIDDYVDPLTLSATEIVDAASAIGKTIDIRYAETLAGKYDTTAFTNEADALEAIIASPTLVADSESYITATFDPDLTVQSLRDFVKAEYGFSDNQFDEYLQAQFYGEDLATATASMEQYLTDNPLKASNPLIDSTFSQFVNTEADVLAEFQKDRPDYQLTQEDKDKYVGVRLGDPSERAQRLDQIDNEFMSQLEEDTLIADTLADDQGMGFKNSAFYTDAQLRAMLDRAEGMSESDIAYSLSNKVAREIVSWTDVALKLNQDLQVQKQDKVDGQPASQNQFTTWKHANVDPSKGNAFFQDELMRDILQAQADGTRLTIEQVKNLPSYKAFVENANAKVTTVDEARAYLAGEGFDVSNLSDEQLRNIPGLVGDTFDNQVSDTDSGTVADAYLAPRQYTQEQAESDLRAELGLSPSADLSAYAGYLSQVVDLTGNTPSADGTRKVQNEIIGDAEIRAQLGDYTLPSDLSAFTGLASDESLEDRVNRYKGQEGVYTTAVTALRQTAESALDDDTQDGGALSSASGLYKSLVDYFADPSGTNGNQIEYNNLATTDERRKEMVQASLDNRRYSESEILADIKTHLGDTRADNEILADPDYASLFALEATRPNRLASGKFYGEDSQLEGGAFDQATITKAEARDYFRNVLGYGEGWLPTGMIDQNIVGVGDEATVLADDPANLTGYIKDLYDKTTVTADKIENELKNNPTKYGFKDSDAVQAAIDGGLDLSKYEGNYWWEGTRKDTNPAFTALKPKLDADTVSEADINAYLASQGFDSTTGVFDSLGFTNDTLANLTEQHRLANEVTDQDIINNLVNAGYTQADIQAAIDSGTFDAFRGKNNKDSNIDSNVSSWKADTANRTIEETSLINAFDAEGYGWSEGELQNLVGSQEPNPVSKYLGDMDALTQAEFDKYGAFDTSADAGFDIKSFRNKDNATNVASAVATYVNDRYTYEGEARDHLASLGLTDVLVTDDNGDYIVPRSEINNLIGQFGTPELISRASVEGGYFDQNDVTYDEIRAELAAQGFDVFEDDGTTVKAGYQNADIDASGINVGTGNAEADLATSVTNNTITEADVRAAFGDITLTDADVAQYVGFGDPTTFAPTPEQITDARFNTLQETVDNIQAGTLNEADRAALDLAGVNITALQNAVDALENQATFTTDNEMDPVAMASINNTIIPAINKINNTLGNIFTEQQIKNLINGIVGPANTAQSATLNANIDTALQAAKDYADDIDTRLTAAIAAEKAAGTDADEVLEKAIEKVASDLNTSEIELAANITANSNRLTGVEDELDALNLELGTEITRVEDLISQEISDLDIRLTAAIAAEKAAGTDADEVLEKAIEKVASDLNTSEIELAANITANSNRLTGVEDELDALNLELGTEIARVEALISAGVVEAKTYTDTEIATLDADLRDEIARVEQANIEAGLSQQEILDLAIENLANQATNNKAELTALISSNGDALTATNSRLGTVEGELTTLANTISEGIAEAKTYTDTEIATLDADLTAEIAANLAEGQNADQALQNAIDTLTANSTNDKTELLALINSNAQSLSGTVGALGTDVTTLQSDVTDLQSEVSGLSTNVQTIINDLNQLSQDLIDQGASSSEALTALQNTIQALQGQINTLDNTDIAALNAAVTNIQNTLANQDFATSEELEAVAAIFGKPAADVTPADLAIVDQLIVEQDALTEGETFEFDPTQLQLYDANSDGVINQADRDLLAANDAQTGATGFYDFLSDVQTQLDTTTAEQTETNQALSDYLLRQELEAQAKREREGEALRAALLGRGRVVNVAQAPTADIDYLYDFGSIFATPSQAGFYGGAFSQPTQQQQVLPYGIAAAEGGLIDIESEETNRLMKELGII
jgi:hypothetical protein